ncbi:hypothetical protein MMC27_001324 [Xylographa pallens]|nr:hypothetical protein [Xylographa pallens]
MAISDKKRREKLERDIVKVKLLEQRILNLESGFKQLKSKPEESEALEQITMAMRMHFFELTGGMPCMVVTNRLLYLDSERTDDSIFAEVYGIFIREYEVVKNIRGIEEIVNEFGTLRARNPAQPLPSSLAYTYLAIIDKCITELGDKAAWEVRMSLEDPAYELLGLKKGFLQRCAEARPWPWLRVV